jgi:hypothetical protein
MPRQLVNHEKLGKFIAKTSGAISMNDDSHSGVRSKSGYSTYTVIATKAGWTCSCPDYARHSDVDSSGSLFLLSWHLPS